MCSYALRAALTAQSAPTRFDVLPIRLENEANLGALAELWLGGRSGVGDFLHVSAKIGIGAAVVLDGRLWRGVHGFAGELGHVPVRPTGPACPCGARNGYVVWADRPHPRDWVHGVTDVVETPNRERIIRKAAAMAQGDQVAVGLGR